MLRNILLTFLLLPPLLYITPIIAQTECNLSGIVIDKVTGKALEGDFNYTARLDYRRIY